MGYTEDCKEYYTLIANFYRVSDDFFFYRRQKLNWLERCGMVPDKLRQNRILLGEA